MFCLMSTFASHIVCNILLCTVNIATCAKGSASYSVSYGPSCAMSTIMYCHIGTAASYIVYHATACLCYGHCCFLFLYAISYYTLLLILCTACIYGQYCLIYLVFIAVLCIVFYSCWHCHIAFPSLYDVTLSLTTSFILIAANLTG